MVSNMFFKNLYQTIKEKDSAIGGRGKERIKRHPTIESNVIIGTGAIILGNITIGKNSKIGAGAIVLKDVPNNTTVVGLYK